jgi:hypothetical protein
LIGDCHKDFNKGFLQFFSFREDTTNLDQETGFPEHDLMNFDMANGLSIMGVDKLC